MIEITPGSERRISDILSTHPMAKVSQFILAFKPDLKDVCIDQRYIRMFGICGSVDELLTKLDHKVQTDIAFAREHAHGQFFALDAANAYRVNAGRLT